MLAATLPVQVPEQLPEASCITVACLTFLHVPAASQPAAITTAVSSSPETLLEAGNPIDLKGDFFLCTRTDLNNSRWAHIITVTAASS